MRNKLGFTLAEVLITLVIIGVIAAITVPTLIAKHQKEQFAIRAKETYSIIATGFKQALAKDGVTLLEDTSLAKSIAGEETTDSGQENFRKEFSKVFKVMSGVQKGNLSEESVMNIQYKTLNGKTTLTPKSESWFEFRQIFNLVNGSIAYVGMYKVPRNCVRSKETIKEAGGHLYQYIGWVAFDTNGVKGPNQFGRDLFSTVISNDGNVYPNWGKDYIICELDSNIESDSWRGNNSHNCNIDSTDSYFKQGMSCLARLMDEGWEMKY